MSEFQALTADRDGSWSLNFDLFMNLCVLAYQYVAIKLILF